YPYACVFIEDKPELVDFNIHPAKKEVKIRNKADIHHTISSMLKTGIERKIPEIKVDKQFYLDDAERWENGSKTSSFGIRKEAEKATFFQKPEFPATKEPVSTASLEGEGTKEEFHYTKPLEKVSFSPERSAGDDLQERYRTYREKDTHWLEKAKALQETRNKLREQSAPKVEEIKKEEAKKDEDEIIYIGQAFKLFLICQKGEELYLVDQHAAHERILYDEILSQKTVQQLLVPIKMEVDDITDEFLDRNSFVYTKLGIHLSQTEKGKWEITAIPALCKGIETQIVDFVTSSKADEHELEEKLFAIIACKAAIKQGDDIDRWSAEAILEKVFEMDEPCCPHGRTFLVKLSAKDLKEMVGRTK
ncbi:MAG: hypothetical protein KBS81_07160, partial [Spirochaetales bacterium]|nr:hypothetical protein [Candidatus Physcosoma equi]